MFYLVLWFWNKLFRCTVWTLRCTQQQLWSSILWYRPILTVWYWTWRWWVMCLKGWESVLLPDLSWMGLFHTLWCIPLETRTKELSRLRWLTSVSHLRVLGPLYKWSISEFPSLKDKGLLRGSGYSGLASLSRYTTFVKLEFSMLRHAISEEEGLWLAYGLLAALKPMVTPLSHSSRPHL